MRPVLHVPRLQELLADDDPYQSDLPGMTLEDLSALVMERDDEIGTLQTMLDQRESEKKAHQEELTELRRSVRHRELDLAKVVQDSFFFFLSV